MLSRDPYGVRPLFMGETIDGGYMFASELKAIHDKCVHVKQFNTGSYLEYKKDYFMIKNIII